MPNSIERIAEDRVISLLNGITGINLYNGYRWGDKAYFGVSGACVVAAKNLGKELAPNCGVWQVALDIEFGAKLSDQNPVSMGYLWEEIRQQLYYTTSLESRLSTTGFTVYGVTKEGEESEVDDENKLWKKTMSLKMWITPL